MQGRPTSQIAPQHKLHRWCRVLVSIIASISLAHTVHAGVATLSGVVVDSATGEPLNGASVGIVGNRYGGFTNKGGQFQVRSVPSGNYTVKVSYVGYKTRLIENVVVDSSRAVTLDIRLQSIETTAQSVLVVAARISNGLVSSLHDRKNASSIGDGISSEEISRHNDASAAQSLQRVTGVTVVEGKYVYVRGVNDRYNSTTLNGSAVATTEANRKSFAYDVIPSNLLQNVTVVKTFTPDLPGSFVGGLVQMNTVDIPDRNSFDVSTSAAGNEQITYRENVLLGYARSSTDWIGIDGGYRNAPNVPNSRDFAALRTRVKVGDDEAVQQWVGIARGFNNSILNLQNKTAPLANSYGLSIGRVWELDDDEQIGAVASLNYGSSFRLTRIVRRGLQSDGELLFDYQGRVTTQSNDLTALGNVAWKLDTSSLVTWKNVLTLSADDEGVYQYGSDLAQSQYRKNLSFEYQQRSLLASTLSATHAIHLYVPVHIDGQVGYSVSNQDQPDYRRFRFQKSLYSNSEDPLEIAIVNSGVTTQGLGSSAGRFYSALDETVLTAKANAMADFGVVRLKAGGLHSSSNRSFLSRSFTYIQAVNSTVDYNLLTFSAQPDDVPNPGVVLVDSNFSADRIGVSEDSRLRDSYSASEQINAAYFMADGGLRFGDVTVRAIAGARIESSTQRLKSYNDQDEVVDVNLATTDVLPSLNLVLSPSSYINIRAAFAQTLSRPSLREFAPFTFYDFQSQSILRGNPTLTRSLVHNYDLRLEWFPQPSEVLAASFFYKKITHAIEETVEPTSSDLIRTYRNTGEPATSIGVELEVRKHLDFVSEFLRDVSVVANAAYIHSEVVVTQGTVTDRRQMWGQSPYTISASANYTNPDWGTSVNLGFTSAGRRIIQVAQIGMYNITPQHINDGPHIYELPRNIVDVTISQRLGNFQLKVSVSNILNSPLVWEQLGHVVSSSTYGVGYKCSLSYSFN